jgi:hypothetical protein
MDILSFLISKELIELGLSAGEFNAMDDKQKMWAYNEIRFQVKSKLRRHVDLLKILDKAISERLFSGCDDVEH